MLESESHPANVSTMYTLSPPLSPINPLIKVIKCDANWWYKEYIEFVFPVLYEDGTAYWVLDPENNHFLKWIYKADTVHWYGESEIDEKE